MRNFVRCNWAFVLGILGWVIYFAIFLIVLLDLDTPIPVARASYPIVFAALTVFFMQLLSHRIFRTLGTVTPGRWIVACIPVLNILFATWLVLSLRDPIEVVRGLQISPIQARSPKIPTASGKSPRESGESLPDRQLPSQTSRTTASVMVDLAQQASSGIAEPRRTAGWWTFFLGAGSSLEIFPPPERIDCEQSDSEAFAEDWQAVAGDMWLAIGVQESETTAIGLLDGSTIQEERDASPE